jgi:DNA repair protein RecO (recombination protein O)
MSYSSVDAIVLRQTPYKDNDMLLTVLTRQAGILTVKARGCRRKGYRHFASIQILAYSHMELFCAHSRYSLQEAELIQAWLPLREDLSKMACALYAADICTTIGQEEMEQAEELDLLLQTLNHLCRKTYPVQQAKSVFEWAALLMAGFGPISEECAVCHETKSGAGFLLLRDGLILCEDCQESFGGTQLQRLPPGALEALRHIHTSALDRQFEFSLESSELRAFCSVAELYTKAMLERTFKSLDFYHAVQA